MSFVVFLGSIPFLVFLCVLALWIYTFVYDHTIIRTYSGKVTIPKDQINTFIDTNIRHRFNVELPPVNTDHYGDDEDYNPRVKNTSPDPFSATAFAPPITALDPISPVKNKVIGTIFSATIALGTQLIVLMMCELVDWFSEDVRLTLFKFTIDSLMLLLTLVQPFLIISLAVNHDLAPVVSKQNYASAFYTLGLFIAWFFFLHKCGDLSQSFKPAATSAYYNSDTKTLIERKINEISIAGITILAVLSGIGSSSTPYKLFDLDVKVAKIIKGKSIASTKDAFTSSPSKTKVLVTETDLHKAIQTFNHTNTLLYKRKEDLNHHQVSKSGSIYNLESQSSDNLSYSKGILSPKHKLGGIMHKVQSFASLSSLTGTDDPEESELMAEIDSLKHLKNSLYEDLTSLVYKYIEQNSSASSPSRKDTFIKIFRWANNAFAVYCIYRVANVVLLRMPYLLFRDSNSSTYELHSKETNLIKEDQQNQDVPVPPTSSKDALAITLAKLILSVFRSLPVSETQLINQLGFIISGSLFICSFSNVVITFRSFSKYLPSANRTSGYVKNWLKHLVIAELLGVYIIATALLIRTNLPSNLSHQISKILSLSGSSVTTAEISMREVEFIDNWFDKVFALSCVSTILSIVIKKSVIDGDLTESYDEESLIENGQLYKTA